MRKQTMERVEHNRLATPELLLQANHLVQRAADFGLSPKEKLELLPLSVLKSMHTYLAQQYSLAPHDQKRFELIAEVMRNKS